MPPFQRFRLPSRVAFVAFVFSAFSIAAPPSFEVNGPSPLAQVLSPGETLQFWAKASGSAPITVTALVKPAGMSVSSSGFLSWTPTALDRGVHKVHLLATNAEGMDEIVFHLAVEPPFFDIVQIDAPGFPESQALGINDLGHVTGIRTGPGMGLSGFLFDGTVFTPIVHAGATWTLCYGLNNLGQVSGTFTNSSGWHGFLWQGGAFTDIPSGFYEYHPYDLDDQGNTVGWVIVSPNSPSKAFASFAPLNLPGATSATYSRAFGLNDRLQAVGDYWQNGAGGFPRQGWLYDHANTSYTVFQVDGGIGTSPYGINNAREVVGIFSAGWEQGFVGSEMAFYTDVGGPAPGRYRRFRVPQANGRVHLLDVNDAGVVVGRFEFQPDDFHGFKATPILPWLQEDLGGGAAQSAVLQVEGEPLYSGDESTLRLSGAPANVPLVLIVGFQRLDMPLGDGSSLVPLPALVVPAVADSNGTFEIASIPGGGGPLEAFVQAAAADSGAPLGFRLSNAVRLVFLP